MLAHNISQYIWFNIISDWQRTPVSRWIFFDSEVGSEEPCSESCNESKEEDSYNPESVPVYGSRTTPRLFLWFVTFNTSQLHKVDIVIFWGLLLPFQPVRYLLDVVILVIVWRCLWQRGRRWTSNWKTLGAYRGISWILRVAWEWISGFFVRGILGQAARILVIIVAWFDREFSFGLRHGCCFCETVNATDIEDASCEGHTA